MQSAELPYRLEFRHTNAFRDGKSRRAASLLGAAVFVAAHTSASSSTTSTSRTTLIPHGQAHQEGRRVRQVRHPVRGFDPQGDQEDGGDAARQVHLSVLRQGQRQAESGGHLGVLQVPKANRRRRMGAEYSGGGYGACNHPPPARNCLGKACG
eukprot:ctg_126.g86